MSDDWAQEENQHARKGGFVSARDPELPVLNDDLELMTFNGVKISYGFLKQLTTSMPQDVWVRWDREGNDVKIKSIKLKARLVQE